jgi:photosystem II stability/assembly factor-like uncharacterized protein
VRRSRLFRIGLFLAALLSAASAFARPFSFKLAPGDTLGYLAGNSVVDLEFDTVLGVPTLWAGTGNGVSVSTDYGVSWRAFTTAQGLNANSVSALHIQGDTVWIGMAHSQDFNGDFFPVGDGFNFTADLGDSWVASAPSQSTGIGYFSQQIFGMLPFDLAGEPSGIWAACFFGGLIRSIDGGQTWFNIFPSAAAKTDFENKNYNELGNRFFSVDATSHNATGDSIDVYAGSAGGINRFLIIDAKRKLAGAPVFAISRDRFGTLDWLATGGGVSSLTQSVPHVYTSYFDSTTGGTLPAGLFLSATSPLTSGPGALIEVSAFTVSGSDTLGAGLYRYFESVGSWEKSVTLASAPQFFGKDSGGYQLLFTHAALWAAGGRSGLWRSRDLGSTWQRVLVDTLVTNPAAAVNRTYALAYDSLALRLYVGTYDGLYRLTLGTADSVVTREPPLYRYTPGDTAAAQIVRKVGAFRRPGGALLLTLGLHRPDTAATQRNAVLFSSDSGTTWQSVRRDLVPWGFAYLRDTIYTATNGGLVVAPVTGGVYTNDTVTFIYETTIGRADSLQLLPGFRSIAAVHDTIWIGGDHGVARRRPGNADWDIDFFVPRDSVDLITGSSFDANSDSSISGDFVIALAIQDYAGQKTLWASTRPTESPQYLGVSRSTDHGRTWSVSLANVITWNLATYQDHVWAATNAGLFLSTNAGTTWTPVPITDTANRTAFYEGTEILAVRQVDANHVFVGSEDGFARSTDGGATWTITRSFAGIGTTQAGGPDAEVFASPVPFSPARDSRLRVHYKPATSGNVTIEVFDFAMQKVATILDGAFRSGKPGPDPDGTNHYVEEWDARNDDGRPVATGVYFFRVEMDGTSKWGKLVILP